MAKMKDYLMDQYLISTSYARRNAKETKARKKISKSKPTTSQAKNNLAMADLLREKPRRIDKKVVKKATKTNKKQTKAEAKALKSINKKPLPARSRSGAASGRGGIRGGLGGGLFGPRVR